MLRVRVGMIVKIVKWLALAKTCRKCYGRVELNQNAVNFISKPVEVDKGGASEVVGGLISRREGDKNLATPLNPETSHYSYQRTN